MRGGHFFVVEPRDALIRIAFLPAYFHDCGWSGFECWLPGVDCSPHEGDRSVMLQWMRKPWSVSGTAALGSGGGRDPNVG